MKQEKVKDQNKVENTNDFKFKNDHEKLNDFHEEKVKVSKENYKNYEKLKDKDKSNKSITKVEINEKDEKQKDNEKSDKNKIIRKDIDENSKDKDKIERNVDKEFFHEKDNFNSFEKEKKKNIKFENSDDFKEKRKDMDDKKSNVRNSKKFNDNSFGNKERKNSKGDISKSEEKHSHIKEYSRHHEFSIEDSQSSFKKGVEKSSKKQDSYINFKVLVRVRPFIKNEIEKGKVVFVNPRDDKNIKLGKNSSYFEFSYEKIFGPFSTQKDIFRSIKNSIDHVINGINSTILLYGQTGSGKTYTMFGSDWTKNERLDNINDISGKSESINSINNKRDDLSELIINPFSEENGFLPRIINYLFSELEILNIKSKKYNVYVSFLQIYNESINDLLDEVQNYDKQNSLRIREDKVNGIYVENITEFLVENVYDCLNLMKRGYKSKKYRQIKKNVLVSRSHTIFQIIVEYDRVNEKGILKRSKLNVCDLAGSEKIEYDKEKISQDQLNEMIKINLSLSTLGQVIHALSIAQNHVPYRDSKLTRFLQDSLRCDTLTYLISTISPSWDSFEESINTLKFADIAKNVKTKIKFSNLDIYDENSIKNLKEEILNLRDILHIRKKRGNITAQEQEILELKTENQKLKEYVLLNTEIQKIVKENKFLKIKLSKYENSDYLELTHNKTNDTNLIEIKEQGKLDPKYSDKLKYYVSQEHDENCISDKMDINYIKKVPKYNNDEKYQNNYDQNDYLKQIENYNYKDDSTYLHHNKKKLFHKQLSPKEKSNELYLNNINSKSFNYKGKIQEKSYQINDINKSNYNHQYLTPTNMISQNNNMKKNENFYKHNPNSNIFVKGADMVLRKINNEYDEREMKSNYRLRILEKLEYETGLNLKNEIEKIKFEKKNLKEENWIKSVEKKKKYERIDSSINKIKYLYDNKNQDQSCNNIYLPNYYDINHNEKNHSSDKRRTKYNYENSDDDFDTLIKKNNLKYKNNKNISNNQNDRQYGESNYDDEANWKKSEIIRNNDENTQFRIN